MRLTLQRQFLLPLSRRPYQDLEPAAGQRHLGYLFIARTKAILAAGATVLSVTFCQTSSAGTAMELTGPAFPPPAFYSFCAKQRALCSTRGSKRVIELTSARKAELMRVNSTVNSRIAQRSDLSTSGKADTWALPSKQGDCEDFAILEKASSSSLAGRPRHCC